MADITAESLGSREFKNDYNLKYAYVSGGMAHGIASAEMVIKMSKAGMLGYFGTGALSIDRIERNIVSIKEKLKPSQAYGMNLLPGSMENETVDLFLKHEIRNIEAAAYVQMTPSLVRYRLKGLHQRPDGTIIVMNRIMGKVSRPEVAAHFLSPAPNSIVDMLLKQNMITAEEARLSEKIPMADDICAEADSGGHTDQGVSSALLPATLNLRDDMMEKYGYEKTIRVGAAGGIGTPEAAAAAFILGSDFILTGSINQCTVEAGTSDLVKDLLEEVNVQDTAYAPAGDMFETGAKVQVMKRGVFFPARANKLFELYKHYNSLDEIDRKTRFQLEKKYFNRSFDEIYEECRTYYSEEEIKRAERSTKQKMALVFRWYLGYSTRLALQGVEEKKVDFQVQCGPALGAFNQWIKNTKLKNWRYRHIDKIAVMIMQKTAELLNQRFQEFIEKTHRAQPGDIKSGVKANRIKKIAGYGLENALGRKLKKKSMVDLSIGQACFNVPEKAKAGAIKAIRSDLNRYSPVAGLDELKTMIAEHVKTKFHISGEAIMITNGTTGGLLLSFLSLIDRGDEILLPDPYFILYSQLGNMCEAHIKYYHLYPDFRLNFEELERKISSRTKAVVINTPGNPTGMVYSEDEIKTICEICKRNSAIIISDEIYSDFTYDTPHISPLKYHEDTILLGGFSKVWGMTGWRLGYAIGPQKYIRSMITLQMVTHVCPPTPLQCGGMDAVKLDVSDKIARYKTKRDLIYNGIKEKYECHRPEGAFYIYPKVPDGYNDLVFTKKAREHDLLVVPGRYFSQRNDYFRISFSADDGQLQKGIEILNNIV